MKKLTVAVLGCLVLSGCTFGAATSATAGYSLQSKSSDELGNKARQSIVDEAVQKSKDYTDQKIALMRK